MQNVHITCRDDALQSLVQDLEEQFAAQPEEVSILGSGYSRKCVHGYVVLEWLDEVDEVFLKQLDGESCVIDYCVYTVASVDDLLFAAEIVPEEEPGPPNCNTD